MPGCFFNTMCSFSENCVFSAKFSYSGNYLFLQSSLLVTKYFLAKVPRSMSGFVSESVSAFLFFKTHIRQLQDYVGRW